METHVAIRCSAAQRQRFRSCGGFLLYDAVSASHNPFPCAVTSRYTTDHLFSAIVLMGVILVDACDGERVKEKRENMGYYSAQCYFLPLESYSVSHRACRARVRRSPTSTWLHFANCREIHPHSTSSKKRICTDAS